MSEDTKKTEEVKLSAKVQKIVDAINKTIDERIIFFLKKNI